VPSYLQERTHLFASAPPASRGNARAAPLARLYISAIRCCRSPCAACSHLASRATAPGGTLSALAASGCLALHSYLVGVAAVEHAHFCNMLAYSSPLSRMPASCCSGAGASLCALLPHSFACLRTRHIRRELLLLTPHPAIEEGAAWQNVPIIASTLRAALLSTSLHTTLLTPAWRSIASRLPRAASK